jgi:ectoine hydroxylase-related dioxygenase (phytanoyl-CoA dioxygenase family)
VQIPDFVLGDRLTPEQTAFFDEHGFIRFRSFASISEIDRLLEALDALEARFVAEERVKVMGTPLRYGRRPDGQPFIQRFAFTSHYAPAFHEFVSLPRFEPIKRLIGADARIGEIEADGVVVNHWINHDGSRYRKLGWHTDGLRELAHLRIPGPMLNVGIYLDDSGPEKGGLRVIPGTHKQGILPMLFGKLYFLDNRPDPREVAVTARKGDLTIHDGRLWHRTAQASVEGDASRRRNMYLPLITGPFHPKSEDTRTPVYHRLQGLVG